MKTIIKNLFAILVGTTLFILPLYLYMRFFSGIPCPDCRYLGSGFESYIIVGVFAIIPTAVEFFICYLITVRNREKINQYVLFTTAFVYAALSSSVGEWVDEFVGQHFSYSWNGVSGYFWPLSILAMILLGVLLNLVVFRKDLLLWKKIKETNKEGVKGAVAIK